MKILTYNIRNWRDDPYPVWERRRTQMVKQFQALNPDIILLQEVCQALEDPNPDNSMILWLSQQMPDYIYVQYANNGMTYQNWNFGGREETEGLAILSKIKAPSYKIIPLGPTVKGDGNLRICLAVYFEQFHLYNCHLSTEDEGRKSNIKYFNQAVGVDEIGMMNGDLNTIPTDPIFKDQLAAWTDLWEFLVKDPEIDQGYTFEAPLCAKETGKLDERIDYFLAGAKFLKTAQTIEVVMNDKDVSGYCASDHLGVIAEFII